MPRQQQEMQQPYGSEGAVRQAPRSGWITPLPQGKNGSAIVRDPRFGRAPGVYPVHAIGTFAIVPPDALAPGDAINLCYIPHGSILTNFMIVTAGVTGTLQDSLSTPTVYGTVAGAVFTMAQMTAVEGQNLGTMYFSTPRAVGLQGPAVVQWQQGITLQIAGAAGTPPANAPMIYMVEWSPVYDGGV